MKNLLAAVFCLLLLIIPWCFYEHYASNTIGSYTDILDNDIMPAVLSEDWETAENKYNEIIKNWENFETVSEYFLDTEAVTEADELINKTHQYIIMRDASNASANAAELKHMLNYLHDNETLSSGNLF